MQLGHLKSSEACHIVTTSFVGLLNIKKQLLCLSCSLLLKFSPLKFLVKLIFFLLMRCYRKVFPKRLSINFIRIQTTFFKFSVEYCKTWAHKFYKCETCKQQIRILWTIYNWQDTKTLLLHYFF